MILDKCVWVVLSGSNIQYYESLGYNIPKTISRGGLKPRFSVKRGTKILVDIEDLQSKSNTIVNVQCDYCSKHFERSYQRILLCRQNGSGKDACGDCRHYKSGESRRKLFSDVAQSFSDRGYILLTKENEIDSLSTDLLSYLCPIHGEKTITWNNFYIKHAGCNECAIETIKIDLKRNAWNRITSAFQSSEYTLISDFEEYTSSRDNCLRCLCDKHGEFKISWANFQRYCGCPICNCSLGERSIMHFLDDNNVLYERPKKFDGLLGVGGGQLSYDFYLPEYNMLIEYQGRQHESPGHFYTASEDEMQQNFIKQQEHDRRKRIYAQQYGYILLEIWYYDFYNIDSILSINLTKQN